MIPTWAAGLIAYAAADFGWGLGTGHVLAGHRQVPLWSALPAILVASVYAARRAPR